MNAEGNVVLNFTVNVADPRRNCTDNVSKLISYDVLNIANNSCIKNAEIYLGYVLYGNVVSMVRTSCFREYSSYSQSRVWYSGRNINYIIH